MARRNRVVRIPRKPHLPIGLPPARLLLTFPQGFHPPGGGARPGRVTEVNHAATPVLPARRALVHQAEVDAASLSYGTKIHTPRMAVGAVPGDQKLAVHHRANGPDGIG